MCGIVGYVGNKPAANILLDGLKYLEYRGYDSAGIAVLEKSSFDIKKSSGKLKALTDSLSGCELTGTIGIGHTRWATHGRPSDENAHPHTDCTKVITVVHNGIIENYLHLKEKLIKDGHVFVSETDTEVIAHLIESFYKDNILEAVTKALNLLEGSYALVVVSSKEPDKIIAARLHSPLVIGLGDEENYLASDVGAFLKYTRKVVYVEDYNIACITKENVQIYDLDNNKLELVSQEINWTADMAERGGYDNFMLKEIHEQPKALRETMRGRLLIEENEIVLPGINLTDEDIKNIDKIIIVACGTAYHAGIACKYVMESLCRISVEVDFASELRYRDPIINERTLAIVISQSGETLDTLVGLKEAKERGAKILAITNVVGSMISREANGVLYTYAGPEIAVASTKAYTTQLMLLNLVALYFAKIRNTVPQEELTRLYQELWELPQKAETILNDYSDLVKIADRYYCFKGLLLMARGVNLSSVLEGALKAKEVSYIHAEGYAAGEMKHGPIAMIDPTFATISINVKSKTYDKMLSNIREVKARSGEVVSICNYGDDNILEYADKVIRVPETEELFSPVLVAIPLQLLAYFIALNRGPSIDKPRNLAKTVTVE